MAISTAEPRWACGRGEGKIPAFLLKAGLFGTLALIVGLILVMGLTG